MCYNSQLQKIGCILLDLLQSVKDVPKLYLEIISTNSYKAVFFKSLTWIPRNQILFLGLSYMPKEIRHAEFTKTITVSGNKSCEYLINSTVPPYCASSHHIKAI